MVVRRSSVSLLVCLSVTNKHENISRTTEWILTKICTHILQKKSMSQKNFGHPRMTLGWINPEFDFFTIPLSPLKMQKKIQNFWAPSVPFTPVVPQSIRTQSSCQYLFTLWGSTSVKAVRKYVDEIDPRCASLLEVNFDF